MTLWFCLWLTLSLSHVNCAVHFATAYDYFFNVIVIGALLVHPGAYFNVPRGSS
jgi:hypothetical protein